MSTTPRTDEREFGGTADAMVVDASFARELERENEKLKRENQRYWGDREEPFKLFSGMEISIRVYDSIGHTVISAYSMEQIERLRAEAKWIVAQVEIAVRKQLGDALCACMEGYANAMPEPWHKWKSLADKPADYWDTVFDDSPCAMALRKRIQELETQLDSWKSAFESAAKIKFETEVALTAARERIAVLEAGASDLQKVREALEGIRDSQPDSGWIYHSCTEALALLSQSAGSQGVTVDECLDALELLIPPIMNANLPGDTEMAKARALLTRARGTKS